MDDAKEELNKLQTAQRLWRTQSTSNIRFGTGSVHIADFSSSTVTLVLDLAPFIVPLGHIRRCLGQWSSVLLSRVCCEVY